jgi:phosphoribosylpyrophosphate synthetase
VIVDDICDGGRTFLEMQKTDLKEIYLSFWCYLLVVHGIFSAGLRIKNTLMVFITNSVSDIDNELVKQLNIF